MKIHHSVHLIVRINRNIVECKEVLQCDFLSVFSGINRNIVEFKGIFSWPFSEPDVCINRNIVECKEKKTDESKNRAKY